VQVRDRLLRREHRLQVPIRQPAAVISDNPTLRTLLL
jgi:hypothetical protein